MKNHLVCVLAMSLIWSLTATCSFADTVSASSPLLCAITEVVECNTLGACVNLEAEDAGLPDFLKIDLAAGKLREATSTSLRETGFKANSPVEGMTVLSGVEGLRGWSAVLSDDNSKLSASISDEQAGFIVFGVCRVDR